MKKRIVNGNSDCILCIGEYFPNFYCDPELAVKVVSQDSQKAIMNEMDTTTESQSQKTLGGILKYTCQYSNNDQSFIKSTILLLNIIGIKKNKNCLH